MLINGLHIRIIHATTGELIRRGRGSAEELSKISANFGRHTRTGVNARLALGDHRWCPARPSGD
jgi:hypothetical protein